VLVLAGCVPGWDKSSFTLEDALAHRDDPTLVGNPRDDTDELCAGVDGCIEGWTTDQADYLRFDSNEAAGEFAAGLGDDGHHSNRVVIDFARTDPDDSVRKAIIEGIDGIHSWE